MSADVPMIRGAEFARRAGITYRKLDLWTRRGLLPVKHEATGSGYHRDYPEALVPLARCIADLVEVGFPPDRAAQLATRLIKFGVAEVPLPSGASLRLTHRRR